MTSKILTDADSLRSDHVMTSATEQLSPAKCAQVNDEVILFTTAGVEGTVDVHSYLSSHQSRVEWFFCMYSQIKSPPVPIR